MKKKTIKYKLDTKKGQTVYHVEVNMRDDLSLTLSTSLNPHGIFVTELKIIHQTARKIALSDEWINLFDRQKEDQKKESYCRYLGDVYISIKTKETSYFPNGIFASCYTLDNPEKCIAKIKRKVVDQINKEYGFLRFIDVEKVIENLEVINL